MNRFLQTGFLALFTFTSFSVQTIEQEDGTFPLGQQEVEQQERVEVADAKLTAAAKTIGYGSAIVLSALIGAEILFTYFPRDVRGVFGSDNPLYIFYYLAYPDPAKRSGQVYEELRQKSWQHLLTYSLYLCAELTGMYACGYYTYKNFLPGFKKNISKLQS